MICYYDMLLWYVIMICYYGTLLWYVIMICYYAMLLCYVIMICLVSHVRSDGPSKKIVVSLGV